MGGERRQREEKIGESRKKGGFGGAIGSSERPAGCRDCPMCPPPPHYPVSSPHYAAILTDGRRLETTETLGIGEEKGGMRRAKAGKRVTRNWIWVGNPSFCEVRGGSRFSAVPVLTLSGPSLSYAANDQWKAFRNQRNVR